MLARNGVSRQHLANIAIRTENLLAAIRDIIKPAKTN
jgi:hypothetical protein